MLTLKTYFRWIWSKLKRTRGQITSNLSHVKYQFFSPPEILLHNYKCGGDVPCCVTVNTHTIVNWKNSAKCYWRLWHITNMTPLTSYEDFQFESKNYTLLRMNLRAMILRGSSRRICHLENVKSYMSYLQQCTQIIKMLTLKTYFG
jgi:hypothetical protein